MLAEEDRLHATGTAASEVEANMLRGGTYQTQGLPVALPSWNTHSCRTFSCTKACPKPLKI